MSVRDRSPSEPSIETGRDAGMTGRRALFAALVLATFAILMPLAGLALSAGGFDALDVELGMQLLAREQFDVELEGEDDDEAETPVVPAS